VFVIMIKQSNNK